MLKKTKSFLVFLGLTALPFVSQAQSRFADTDKAGKLDGGKMWTFDNAPLAYFKATYNFSPDATWFEKARLGALRFATYCSASFVSPNGLVMTNHHCARESVTKVSNGGGLVDHGFVAKDLKDEIKVPDLFVEQLIEIKDVTAQVNETANKTNPATDAARDQAKTQAATQLEKDLTAAAGPGNRVQVIRMYSGANFSAYTFKRYDDIRLVMAPELAIAYFGGDSDNFTYPRFNLDMAFFRAYGADGKPLATTNYFPFSKTGLKEGDAVFTLGNPGTTNRLQTVSILEYRRDIAMPAQVNLLKDGLALLKKHWDPKDEEKMSTYFSLSNSLKALEGRLAGLQDPVLIRRKQDAENQLQTAIEAKADLKTKYGTVISQVADIQRQKREIGNLIAGIFGVSNGYPFEASLFKRAFFGTMYQTSKAAQLKEAVLGLANDKPELEEALLTMRLKSMLAYFGMEHEIIKAAGISTTTTPEAAAKNLIASSKLATQEGVKTLLEGDWNGSNDPAIVLAKAVAQGFANMQGKLGELNAKERSLLGQVANAKFEIYGTSIPPDATFSLRISDGFVKGYPYNGTTAPAFTTFYGLLDRYHGFNGKGDWALPTRYQNLPKDLDLSTPFNFTSTNDIIGGNSGSPLVNTNLEVVGLAFDSNVEGLPGEFIYVDTANRTVSVDARAMVESLDKIYDTDRIANELRSGKLFVTEADADGKTAKPVTKPNPKKKK